MKLIRFMIVSLLVFSVSFAENQIANLRDRAGLTQNNDAPRIALEINNDVRLSRDYPMAPPVIPHKIEGYQVDLNANKCLACHNRQQVSDSQAPMISVTHFMDRNGNFLADVSPNRYFCSQCHVSQMDVTPLITNEFISIDQLLQRPPSH